MSLSGVPRELIHTTRIPLDQVAEILSEEIRKINHVTLVVVNSIALNSETRHLTYNATIFTDFEESATIEVQS